jgi:hypothetical protein
MNRLGAALCWSGSTATVSMFVVTTQSAPPALDPAVFGESARVDIFELVDERGSLKGKRVYEYDVVWVELPLDLEARLRSGLDWALQLGASIAWYGFEGSFDFDYLLHPSVADQVYGVAAGEAVRLALDDATRLSTEWQELLGGLRRLLMT